jgi:pimeloyl-ACP methyl ester carboxylesterase
MLRRRSKHLIPITASLVAGGALAGTAFAMAEYVFRELTSPSPARFPLSMGFTPFELNVEWEEVTFSAEGGTLLGGWLLPRGAQAPAILACGGYRGRRSDLLGISASLWRAGFTVLLFDYRGYGDEPGPVTLGYRELADTRAALNYLRQLRPRAPVGVIGFSMGAAIAIMLAAREPDVRAVVADSPFTSQWEIVRFHVGNRWRLGPARSTEAAVHLILLLVERKLLRQFGFRFEDVHPMRDVAQLGQRPLLLIHGEADSMIPVEHGRRMAEAAREAGVPVESWFLPAVGHCGAYFADRVGYCRRVTEFFTRHVRAAPEEGAPTLVLVPAAS